MIAVAPPLPVVPLPTSIFMVMVARFISTPSLAVAGAVLGGVALLIRAYVRKPSPRAPLPPGPRPLPLIGNLFDMPKEDAWRVFQRYAEQHGSTLTLRVSRNRCD
jgi:hypothetical protein